MGTNFTICDCKNRDLSTESNIAKIDGSTNQNSRNQTKQFLKSIHPKNLSFNSIKDLNIIDLNRNGAVDKIIKNYRLYKSHKIILNSEDKNSNSNIEKRNNNINYIESIEKSTNINNYIQNNNINDFQTPQKQNNYFSNSKNTSSNKINIDLINSSQNNKLKTIDILNSPQNNINEDSNSSISQSSKLKQIKSLSGKKSIYIGSKENDKKKGFGIQKWPNGAIHIGTYLNDKASGYGKFIAGNDKYEGEFSNDGACGYGIYYHGNDTIYEGYWIDDSQETFGIETWKDNSQYKGEYKNGKKYGIGIYIWPDGSMYEGEWVDNSLNGYGIYYFTNNRAYLGEWKMNVKDGFGEFIWPDKRYIGFYVNDKKEGFGIYYWNKINKAFVGFWKKGKQDGFGKFMTKNKKKFGKWKMDKVDWFNSEDEAYEFLKEKGLDNYKGIFNLNLDDINNYFINNNDTEKILNWDEKNEFL